MNDDGYLVTVIVPTYNRADFLKETLPELISQTRRPDRVIVVDDGSIDDTKNVVSQFGEGVDYIYQENSGKSTALNHALSIIEGGLVWIFDDDDIPAKDALYRLIAPFVSDPHLDFTYGHHDFLENVNGYWQHRSIPNANERGEHIRIAALKECFINQQGMLVARRAYEKVGLFDEEMLRSQDYEMLLRLARYGRSQKVDGIVFSMRKHPGHRGPKKELAAAAVSSLNWLKYDKIIFGRIWHNYRLEEYVDGDMDEILATTTRMSAMARRGLWSYSARDCAAIRTIVLRTGHLRISKLSAERVSTIFDWGGHGLTTVDESRDFFQELSKLPFPLQLQFRAALMRPLYKRLRPAVRQLNKIQLERIYSAFRSSVVF